MKGILLSLLLLLSLPLLAQVDSTRARTAGSAAHRLADYQLMRQAKEQELRTLLSQYAAASPEQRQQLRGQARTLLLTIFDLSIETKQAEARGLSEQLQRMEKSKAYENRSEDLQLLRDQLQQVQSSIDFRKAHRQEIVERRLGEILP